MPRYLQYSSRSDRLKTFWAWPHRKPSNHECVRAGFFYTGPSDLVRCFCCGIGLKDFSEFDDPMEEHIKHAPKCAYLESLYGVQGLQHRHQQIISMDQGSISQMQYLEFKRNQVNSKPYRHPEMSPYDKRLETFRDPNFRSVISPDKLADAGLYYIGESDLVRCFACDGGFRNWEVNDDPWTEHCRWFPSCRFAREVKGDAFTENVHQETMSPIHENLLADVSNQPYRYPEQAEIETRLATFHGVNSRFPINVEELAQAGLYYIGFRDWVRCFACGIGLRNWKKDSDPLLEHMKRSSTCIFLKELIGDDFVSQVAGTLLLNTNSEASVFTCRNMGSHENDSTAVVLRFDINGDRPVSVDSVVDDITCMQIEQKTKMQDPIESMNQLNVMIAENTGLKELITCRACKCSDKDVVLLPCQHWVMCKRCASSKKKCPTCKTNVEDMFPAVLMPSIKYIVKENGRLKKQLFCQNCQMNSANALFLPCAHHIICIECAQDITKCHICKCEVSEVIRTFMN